MAPLRIATQLRTTLHSAGEPTRRGELAPRARPNATENTATTANSDLSRETSASPPGAVGDTDLTCGQIISACPKNSLLSQIGERRRLSLLARAALYRHTGAFPRARRDLQEVFDIAEPSGMRLHLTDYHVEMARLLLAESDPDEARRHADSAEELIEATGYKRRLPDLAALRERLG